MMHKKWKVMCPSSKDSIYKREIHIIKKKYWQWKMAKPKIQDSAFIQQVLNKYLLHSYYGTDYSQQLEYTSEQKN